MADIIRVFDFVVNFQEDKFERKDGSTDVITIVESDNKSTRFKFYFEEELQDGTNVLVKIKHNIGFAKDYVLCIKNKEAELVLTNSITIAGFLKMTISFVGNDNEILTPAQFQNKILVKEAITGETPIPEDDSKLLEGLISQVNLLNDDTKKAVEGIENTFDQINKKLDKKIETINEKDNEQDGKITLNKEAIEELHTENLEIKAENERLRNDIKSIAVVNEVSGENIHIEDSSNARCEIEIGGNHQQDTREGYNFLDLSNFSTQTKNDVTATKNEDGSIKLVGTNSGDTFNINLSTINGEIGDYIVSGVTGGSRETYFLAIVQTGVKTFTEVTNGSSNFSLTEETTIAANIYIVKGATINTTIYPMMIKGTENKPYEQYGASPSILYPSEAKSVGDNVNLFPGWEMGTIDVDTGNKITDPYYIRSVDFIPILPNIDYTLYKINSFGFNSLNTALRLYDKDKKYLGNQYLGEILVKSFAFKISNPSVRFMIPTSTNGQTNVIPKNAKIDIKLEKGIIATPYSSYNCGSAKVDIKNENIFNTENVKSTSEVSVVDNKNGVLELQGINGFWKGITTTQKFETGKRVYVKCKYVAGTGSAANIGIKDTNGDDILENYKVSNNLISCSFISKGITKIFFRCNGTSNNGNIKYSDIMFSYEDIDYVPNQEQSYLVDVQQPMFEGDTFVKQDGKWYEKHCVKTEIMLTFPTTNIEVCGTFANFQTNRNIAFAVVKNDLKTTNVRNDILCDKLKAKDNSMWGGKEEGIQTYINSNKFMISIPFEDIEKNFGEELTINNYSQAFRKYINDNGPFKIYYLLEEPELIECTEAQNKVLDEIYNKSHTYKNITNISAESSEVNPIINVKYLKDTEAEHNKLQAQIDEIKQLLSPTETSAMLLNNMQTDLESEV